MRRLSVRQRAGRCGVKRNYRSANKEERFMVRYFKATEISDFDELRSPEVSS